MNRTFVLIWLVGVVGLFLVLGPMRINVDSVGGAKVQAATEVLSKAIDNPNGRIPESVLQNAAAIAVVPDIFQRSMLYERGYGDGIIVVRTEGGTWSNPAFLKFLESGEAKKKRSDDIILVFNDRKSIDLFKRGGFILGRDVSTAAGPVTNQTDKMTDEREPAGVYSYAIVEGRLTGIDVDRAVLQVNDWANRDFYSSRSVTFETLLAKGSPKVPVAANQFTCVVARFSTEPHIC
jgi:lipid-binding SYLF domain-containing protein